MVKTSITSSIICLFTHTYHRPLIPPVPAAYLATAIEPVFPVLLGFGLLSRVAAAFLFVYNIVAVAS
jgi:putative oxidoreductase